MFPPGVIRQFNSILCLAPAVTPECEVDGTEIPVGDAGKCLGIGGGEISWPHDQWRRTSGKHASPFSTMEVWVLLRRLEH